MSDAYGIGFYSPDKVSVKECPRHAKIELQGLDSANRESSLGSSVQVCTDCAVYLVSECSLPSTVVFTGYEGTVRSFLACAFPCKPFSLNVDGVVVISVCAVLAVLFVTGFYFLENSDVEAAEESNKKYEWEQAFNLFLFVIIPVADTITDLAYLLTCSFYRTWYFSVAVVAFMIPNLAFGVLLYQRDSMLLRPKMYFPFFECVPPSLQFEAHDNLGKLLVAFVVYTPYALLNLPHLTLKFALGMMLYSTKVFAIGGVYNVDGS